jgi:hypothetical protein
MVGLTTGAASAKTLFMSETAEIGNSDSTTWADAFFADIKLTTYSNQCIELRFSTEARTDGSTLQPHIAFRALVDDSMMNPAAEVVFEPSEFGSYDSAAFSWYLCNLSNGRHTVQVQFSPYATGNTAVLRSGSLMIEIKSGKFVF